MLMVFLRVYRGVADHAAVRATEWLMIAPALGMSIAFSLAPDMFSISPSFEQLARWADERTWQAIVLACAAARLTALVINGTFKGFRLSPHIRFAASLAGILFWSQFTLCIIVAYLTNGGSPSGVVAYGTFCLAELLNLYRSGSDIGRNIGARDGGL